MTSTQNNRPCLQRKNGMLPEGFACAKAQESIIEHERRALAMLAKKCSRHLLWSSTRSLINEDLDEASLHAICTGFSKRSYGDSEHTEQTSNSSFNFSFNSCGEDGFVFSKSQIEFQREALAAIEALVTSEEQQQHGIHQDELPEDVPTEQYSEELIEVSPGVCLPLIGSKETWVALLEGRLAVTKCSCCKGNLSCIEDAQLVICSDCWVISPVDQSIAGISLENNAAEGSYSVGIGIKASEIGEWISAAQQE
jgi:hypothetical protein